MSNAPAAYVKGKQTGKIRRRSASKSGSTEKRPLPFRDVDFPLDTSSNQDYLKQLESL